MTLLDKIVESKRLEFPRLSPSRRTTSRPSTELRFKKALRSTDIAIIGEIKPKSPSLGAIMDIDQLDKTLDSYQRHCAAISVLTDGKFFGGSFELLARVAERTQLPVLCKDFIVSERQIALAQEAGAAAVLLITKILSQSELQDLFTLSFSYGLQPVVEVNNEAELALAGNLAADVVLINNRNLDTMKIDLATTERLSKQSRDSIDFITISASGLSSGEEILRLLPYATCFLVGTALMKSADPDGLLRDFKRATTGNSQPLSSVCVNGG